VEPADARRPGSSLAAFEKIAEDFPEFAPAHSGIADAYSLLGYYGYRAPNQAFPLAEKAADRALARDPGSAEALASRAWIDMIYRWKWEEARTGFGAAISADPDYATAHQWYSFFLMMKKETNESIKEIETAHRLEPLSPIISKSVGQRWYHKREYDEAVRWYNEALTKEPSDTLTHYWRGLAYEQKALDRATPPLQRPGLLASAIQDFEDAMEYAGNDVAPTVRAALGHAYALSGDTARANQMLAQLWRDRKAGRYVSPVAEATIQIGLFRRAPAGPNAAQHKTEALRRLQQAVDERASDLVLLNIEPRSIRYEASRPSAKSAKSWDCNKPAWSSRSSHAHFAVGVYDGASVRVLRLGGSRLCRSSVRRSPTTPSRLFRVAPDWRRPPRRNMEHTPAAEPSAGHLPSGKRRLPLYVRVLIGVVLGATLGVAFGKEPYPLLGLRNEDLGTLGMLVIKLLRALAVPLVLFAILDAFAKTNIRARQGGRLILICLVNVSVAMLIGLTIMNTLRPGDRWRGTAR
jgi:tetratricopeptide (TPR) repeat protein